MGVTILFYVRVETFTQVLRGHRRAPWQSPKMNIQEKLENPSKVQSCKTFSGVTLFRNEWPNFHPSHRTNITPTGLGAFALTALLTRNTFPYMLAQLSFCPFSLSSNASLSSLPSTLTCPTPPCPTPPPGLFSLKHLLLPEFIYISCLLTYQNISSMWEGQCRICSPLYPEFLGQSLFHVWVYIRHQINIHKCFSNVHMYRNLFPMMNEHVYSVVGKI